jgi:quercetin dioxygenase-like cupin family protein
MTRRRNDREGIAPAEVSHLESLIDYQDSAIVSRTIVSKPTGTVTLFAFDTGQALSEHSTPFDALVYVLDGAAEITISGELCRVERGQTVLMPADEPHAVNAAQRFKMMLVMIKS